MSKKTKIIIICVCVAIIAVAMYFYFRKPKTVVDPATGGTSTPGTTGSGSPTKSPATSSVSGTGATTSTGSTGSTAPAATAGNDDFPLKVGSSGDRVKLLQNALKRIKPSLTLPSDGIFNEATRTAVITWVGTAYYPVSANNYSAIMIKSTNN